MNEITGMLGCRQPVIQGAMGMISNTEMVAAVSEAGGFGLLATGFLKGEEEFRQQIEAVKRLTDKPFGLNLPAWKPESMAYARIVAETGLRAVTTSAGSPEPLVPFLKELGLTVLHVVPDVEGALRAEAAGADAIIAEGTESGGVQGTNGVSTMVLVPAVVDAVKVPVAAAGGIADSRGYRAALALGAKGVQAGTVFIASRECMAHANIKEYLCRARETDTVLMGRDRTRVRIVRTPLVEQALKEPEGWTMEASRGRQGEVWWEGDLTAGPFSAGQVVGLIKEVRTVREIIEEMVS